MDWVERVLRVRRGRSNTGERAPRKPLLLLLAHFQREGSSPIVFSAVEAQLERLLREFGRPGGSGAGYPFHHLESDGLWVVRTAAGYGSPGRSSRVLREAGAAGQFSPDLQAALRHDPALLARLARAILDDNFELSLHADISDEVGLSLEIIETGWRQETAEAGRLRDPQFRLRVLRAYEYRCSFCGYDGWLDDGTAVGLDAAHVRWWAFGGPDDVDNGLCLCSLHHKLFDRGVLGVTPQRSVAVSAAFVGRGPAAESQVVSLAGRSVSAPQGGFALAREDHIAWHTREVFRAPPRVPVTPGT